MGEARRREGVYYWWGSVLDIPTHIRITGNGILLGHKDLIRAK